MGRNGMGPGVVVALAMVLAALVPGNGQLAAQGAPGAYGQAAPAAPESLQRTFTFVGNDLRVTIAGPGAGTLRVNRGEVGQISVVARSAGGVPAAALAEAPGRSEMSLDSGAAGRVDYVLTIPADARLSVRLAGRPAATLSPVDQSGGWSWPAHTAEPLQPLPQSP